MCAITRQKFDLLKQLAEWLSRNAAVQHADRLMAMVHSDFVRAAEMGMQEVMEGLHKARLVDPFAIDPATGKVPASSALAAAVAGGHVGCVKWLLGLRADPNAAPNEDGCPPLIVATRAGDSQLVAELLNGCAEVGITWSKLTAAEWALHCGHDSLARTLGGGQFHSAQMMPSAQRAPAARVDRTVHRLCPPAQGAGMWWLDLSRLRPRATNLSPHEQTLLRKFPELRHQLEYSLRVWLNGGNEDVPIEVRSRNCLVSRWTPSSWMYALGSCWRVSRRWATPLPWMLVDAPPTATRPPGYSMRAVALRRSYHWMDLVGTFLTSSHAPIPIRITTSTGRRPF